MATSALTHGSTARTLGPMRSAIQALVLMAVFAVTRFINIRIWKTERLAFVQNDITYYFWGAWCQQAGVTQGDAGCVEAANTYGILGEYPVPATWLVKFLYNLAWLDWHHPIASWGQKVDMATAQGQHAMVYVAAMLLLDAFVAIMLFRRGNFRASLFWIVFIGACGPIAWFRLDLVTAALVALACLYLVRRPAVAGALVGIGAAIKLWPALLALPMAAPDPRRNAGSRRRIAGFLVAGVGLALVSLVTHGWHRNVASLLWQQRRGLQQESVPATPILFLRTFVENPQWRIELSEFKAIEFFGPGVSLLLGASTVMTVASVVLAGLLTWRLLRNHRTGSLRYAEAAILVVLAIVLAMMVSNKVLSTQYVQWLAGPIAALFIVRRSEWLRRPLHVMAVLMVIVAAVTQFTYPWGTMGIMGQPNAAPIEGSSLILRNVMLLGIAVWTAFLAWRATAAPVVDGAPVGGEPAHEELDVHGGAELVDAAAR